MFARDFKALLLCLSGRHKCCTFAFFFDFFGLKRVLCENLFVNFAALHM